MSLAKFRYRMVGSSQHDSAARPFAIQCRTSGESQAALRHFTRKLLDGGHVSCVEAGLELDICTLSVGLQDDNCMRL